MGTPGPDFADPRRQYAFGEFTLDLDGGFLRRGAEEVALRPKPFEVLVYLVEHHGRLITKAALTEAVWPDSAVVDNSLAQCVVEIRRALGDDAQQLIRTVSRRGYVFAAPVTAPVVQFPRAPENSEARRGIVPLPPEPTTRTRQTRHVAIGALALLGILALGWPRFWPALTEKRALTYTQITNFTDSAVSPALSPDGRMLAFIRSDSAWLTPDQIYVMLLPDGDPVQLTHDSRPKYGLAFSPDGSRLVYTVLPWSTYAVSPLGGEPTLLLTNTSGVT